MLNCDESIDLLAELADGEIAPALRARLDEHLRTCAACRTELNGQRLVRDLLAARPRDVPPEGLLERLLTRLESERPAAWFELPDWRRWSLRLMPAAALLLLLGWASVRSRPPAETVDVTAVVASLGFQGGGPAALFARPDASEDTLFLAVLAGHGEPPPEKPADER